MDIREIMDRYPNKPEYLIEMLLDVDQASDQHYITEHDLKQIATYLDVRISHVCSVMSFYTMLSTSPRGRYVVQVCKDVPCYLNDDFNVLSTIEELLGIRLGETSRDMLFSLEQTACIGCCDQAPAIRINQTVYTNLSEESLEDIFASYRGGYRD